MRPFRAWAGLHPAVFCCALSGLGWGCTLRSFGAPFQGWVGLHPTVFCCALSGLGWGCTPRPFYAPFQGLGGVVPTRSFECALSGLGRGCTPRSFGAPFQGLGGVTPCGLLMRRFRAWVGGALRGVGVSLFEHLVLRQGVLACRGLVCIGGKKF